MQAIIFDLDDTLFNAENVLYDDVQNLLAILRRLGIKIGALSSDDHRALVRLDEAGISKHFDHIICSDHIDEPKAPEAVHQLLQALRTQPTDAALVSHAKGDIALGKHAGLAKTIRVSHGPISEHERHGADHLVENIPAVLDVLE
jgi:phosphoglycolate phosphatase-like HAD superfamily hydrolase